MSRKFTASYKDNEYAFDDLTPNELEQFGIVRNWIFDKLKISQGQLVAKTKRSGIVHDDLVNSQTSWQAVIRGMPEVTVYVTHQQMLFIDLCRHPSLPRSNDPLHKNPLNLQMETNIDEQGDMNLPDVKPSQVFQRRLGGGQGGAGGSSGFSGIQESN